MATIPEFTKEESALMAKMHAECGGLVVEYIIPEWVRLACKPFIRGGDVAVYKGVSFKSKLESEMTSGILTQMSGDGNPQHIHYLIMAFTLGLWLGQTHRSNLDTQIEDLDA